MTCIKAFLEASAHPDYPGYDENLAIAARNAAPEIAELVEWVRENGRHTRHCVDRSQAFEQECTCGLDRIREIVGE